MKIDKQCFGAQTPGSTNNPTCFGAFECHMVQKSFYDVLLVNHDATLDEIKQAFKRRALQVHPDKGGSKEQFHAVYQALEILSDQEARKRYDFRLKSGGPQVPAKRKAESTSATCATRPSKPARSNTRESGYGESKPLPRELQKILSQIHELLKEFDRNVRQEIIVREFSQQQRLLLEQWIVDHAEQRNPDFSAPDKQTKVQEASSRLVLREPGGSQVRRKSKTLRKTEKKYHMRGIYPCSKPGKYMASVSFHGLEIQSGGMDLPTALEYFVLLTAVKQKMLTYDATCFAEHLEEALMSSALEQGRNLQELSISFAVQQRTAMFIGNNSKLRTPRVKNIRQVVKIYKLLAPFRSRFKGRGDTKTRTLFDHHSIADVEIEWNQFQQAVADAWEVASVDSTEYNVSAAFRARHLQIWGPDIIWPWFRRRVKHRPGNPSVFREEEDKEGRDEESKDAKAPTEMGEVDDRTLSERKRQEHSRILLRQQKKHREERRRMQVLEQKRRQKALRQRMKADLTMDEILGRRNTWH